MKVAKKINQIIDRIPPLAGVIMLLLSITFSNAYSSQDMTMLIYMSSWGTNGASAETFGWWFYIVGGLVFYGVFELIMRVIIHFIRFQLPVLQKPKVYHYIRVIFTFNYLILGAFHLTYFFFPLLQTIGVLVDFFVSSIFLYIAYHLISRNQLPNFLWARALKSTASIFFIFHGLNVLVSIVGLFGGLI